MVAGLPGVAPLLLARDAAQRLSEIRTPGGGLRHLLLSEEDILGDSRTITGACLYPDLSRLALLRRMAGRGRMEIYLSIRSLDGFLPSAYAEIIKGRRYARSDFHRFVKTFRDLETPWTDLVKRIRQAVPSASVHVWTQEDYAQDALGILEHFTGLTLGALPQIERPARTRTPGEAAIAEAEALEYEGPDRADRVRALFQQDVAGDFVKFDPLTAEDKAAFQESFARELAGFRKNYPDMLVERV